MTFTKYKLFFFIEKNIAAWMNAYDEMVFPIGDCYASILWWLNLKQLISEWYSNWVKCLLTAKKINKECIDNRKCFYFKGTWIHPADSIKHLLLTSSGPMFFLEFTNIRLSICFSFIREEWERRISFNIKWSFLFSPSQ